jgi:exopolysaccharide production protein ExoQ
MNPYIAAFICTCGIVGLFYLDRDNKVRTSKALWLPIIYLAMIGSRPVSAWFGLTWADAAVSTSAEGSPIDAAIFGVLLLAAVGVLISRWRRVSVLLFSNWIILIYFAYCFLSITWAYQPEIAFKRWIKATDDLAMVLIIVTDPRPVAALRRLVSRVGFVLLPTSVLLIKYFPLLGRQYSPDGMLMSTGVTMNKNELGVTVLVIALCTLWSLTTLREAPKTPDRRRHLIAHVVLLGFGILLLRMANSATSLACFVLGAGFIFVATRRAIRRRPARVHALAFAIVFAAALTLVVGAVPEVARILGRQSNLSGRTEIWAAVLPQVPNPIIGAGFESFWISPNVVKFQQGLAGWWHPEQLNEAHNGYIEVYLNLGWIGIVLIASILISGYWRGVKAFRRDQRLGALMLSYVIASSVYGITEAGFRMLDPMWLFLLLAIYGATGIARGLYDQSPRGTASRRISASAGRPAFTPVGQTIYAK